MLILTVFAHVKAEHTEAFREATIENARYSVQEPGIARFDFIQQIDDPTRFMLVEVYRSQDAIAQHKETAHYQAWVAQVPNWLAEPRTRALHTNVFPGDEGW